MPLPLLPVVAWFDDWVSELDESVELELSLELLLSLELALLLESSVVVPLEPEVLLAVCEDVVLPA
jgi:hypothetical protein